MATMLDWNALSHKLNSYVGEYAFCTSPKRAFTHVMLEYVLSLTPEEIEDAATDGPDDRGIDAVFVDDRDGSNAIHLFQFKHVDSFQKAKNNFPSNEIDKMLSFCAELLDQNTQMKRTCNPILWTKVQEIWEALERPDPSFEVHFCGNMKPMLEAHQRRVEGALRPYKSFNITNHSLDSIVNLFLEKKHAKVHSNLRVVDKNYFERTDGNIRGLIVTLEAEELVKLVRDPDNPRQVRLDVFNDNVRVYLTKKNRVNKKIHATALSDTNAEFWYLNNGITLTCDSFSYQPGTRAPTVKLENVQIVNGGQTSNAIFEAHLENANKVKHVLVLARIYETRTSGITSKIAEVTNSQTPINTRDLRSNDDIQRKLEESFSDQDLYYERKYRQHHSEPKSGRIDSLSAGQAFLAYELGYPEVAKKDRAKVFGEMYDNIFNEKITPTKLLVPLRVHADIESRKRDLQKKIKGQKPFDSDLLFLIDGAYHSLFAVAEICEAKGIERMDELKAKAQIPAALDLLKRLVKEESKADEAFTTSRFFKDAKTKGKIQRLVAAESYSRGAGGRRSGRTKTSSGSARKSRATGAHD
ncbi:MAG: AIPR family protein [Nitrospirales bacterium]|nr:AIPR family protein [Nitrospirales bacterium]